MCVSMHIDTHLNIAININTYTNIFGAVALVIQMCCIPGGLQGTPPHNISQSDGPSETTIFPILLFMKYHISSLEASRARFSQPGGARFLNLRALRNLQFSLYFSLGASRAIFLTYCYYQVLCVQVDPSLWNTQYLVVYCIRYYVFRGVPAFGTHST